MAVGFAGSGGGVGATIQPLSGITPADLWAYPLEASIFVNNTCNLHCRHCYVNYERHDGGLSAERWCEIFGELIGMGARTLGIVGMEPLRSWRITSLILRFCREKQGELSLPILRSGFVTNATLLTDKIAEELMEILPHYMDVSVDGDEKTHDKIRGEGAYRKTIGNVAKLTDAMKERVFVSYTFNTVTAPGLSGMVDELYSLGIRKFNISPYHTVAVKKEDKLWATSKRMTDTLVRFFERLDFSKYPGLVLYVKTDYQSTGKFADEFVKRNIIKLDDLVVDEYGTIYSIHEQPNGGVLYLNYEPVDRSFKSSIRISHDGLVSTCLQMFYKDFPYRAIGNLERSNIADILVPYRKAA